MTTSQQIVEAVEKTRERARALAGLPPGWEFWHVELHAEVVPEKKEPRGYDLRNWGNWKSSPHEHVEWKATAFFARRPFIAKGRRCFSVVVEGNRPLAALQRLRTLMGRRWRQWGSRNDPVRFTEVTP